MEIIDMTGGALTKTNAAGTGGLISNNIQYTPYTQPNYWPYTQYYYVTQPPQSCSGDVHVFPCPHCDKCKCGAATVKRAKTK